MKFFQRKKGNNDLKLFVSPDFLNICKYVVKNRIISIRDPENLDLDTFLKVKCSIGGDISILRDSCNGG